MEYYLGVEVHCRGIGNKEKCRDIYTNIYHTCIDHYLEHEIKRAVRASRLRKAVKTLLHFPLSGIKSLHSFFVNKLYKHNVQKHR